MPRLRLAARRAGVLARYAGHEARVVAQIAPPQPPRLLSEAEEPLEAESLHERGRLRHQPGMEVEGGADADQDRRSQARAHAGHPLLLLRDADADPDDVRAGGVDSGRDGLVLGVGELAE